MKNWVYLYLILFFFFSSSFKKQEKSILRTCFNKEPCNLDSRKANDYISIQMMYMLYSGLARLDSNNNLSLCIAKSFKASKDKKKYIFYLKDAFWSDGNKITAFDFEKSWKKILEPNFPSKCSDLLYIIKNAEKAKKGLVDISDVKVKAIDNKTLVVELEYPSPNFLYLTSLSAFFPMPEAFDEKKDFLKKRSSSLITSGPFKISKWSFNNQIILEKNLKYINIHQVLLDRIDINIVPNEESALQMYENNQIDLLCSFLSPLNIDSLSKISKRQDVIISPMSGFNFITFNTKKFPFTSQNLRKAFSSSICRRAIVKNITQLNEKIANKINPFNLDFEKELFDKKLAETYFQKGLNELNIKKDQLDITLIYGSYGLHKKQAEALKQMWEKSFDINIKLQLFEDKTLFSKLQNKDYQIGLTSLILKSEDPLSIFERYKFESNFKNYSNWEDKNYIKILDEAKFQVDVEKKLNLIEQLEEIILEKNIFSPLYFYNLVLLKKPYVKKVFSNSVGDLFFDEIFMENYEYKK